MSRIRMMIQKAVRPLENVEGATALEYGLLASLIAVVIIGSVTAVGVAVDGAFAAVAAAM